ncbi:MAG: 3-hydroxy-3-methylglutaryl-CoA reductase [Parcubacteria group bacterium]|nr:3-hydroxy-3-methylglutaryl-CoA reductase [Parcubacteria group bacterium]
MIDESRIRSIEKVEKVCYTVGPLLVHGNYAEGEFDVPLITAEELVVVAVNRGRGAIFLAGGANVTITRDEMTRAPLITTTSPKVAIRLARYINHHLDEIGAVAESTTRFGKLTSIEPRVHHSDIYLRVAMFCGDAAGHNMVEKAAIAVSEHLENLREFKDDVHLFSVSSNYCTDKKPSVINLEKGRGKQVVASIEIPRAVVRQKLKALPEEIVALNYKKNIVGSRLAGTLGGENSHHVNMISAVFSATGQDVANVVEASMGYTRASCTEESDLKFSIEIPCLICGTVGGGTRLPYAQANLEKMHCVGGGNPPGTNAKKFAEIIGAVVLAGELSTMAELTKGGKFIEAHLKSERR